MVYHYPFWEKEYLKQNPDKKIKKEPRQKPIQKQEYKPHVEDVAGAVSYLLSKESERITGTVITVDGGSTA